MQAEFVWSQNAGNFRVALDIYAQGCKVADIIHALLKATNIARGQAHPMHTQAAQFAGDVDVLVIGRGSLGFVDGDFYLARLSPGVQVAEQARHMSNSATVFRGGTQQVRAAKV